MNDLKDKDTIYVKSIDDDDDNKDGMTFDKFCHQIWVAKITWLVSMVAIFVVCALGIQLGYTRPKATYTATGTINFPGAESGVYPNGFTFVAGDLVSKSNLQAAVDSNSDLKGINVNKMITKGDITISYGNNQDVIDASGTSSNVVFTEYKNIFNVSILSKYFTSDDQAREFFNAMYSIPVSKAKTIYDSKTYDSYLVLSKRSGISYDTQLSNLVSQYSYIVNNYNSLITIYSDQYVTIDGSTTTLTKINDKLQAEYSNLKVGNLSTTIDMNGYVKDPSKEEKGLLQEQTTLTTSVTSYQTELKSQEAAFTALYGSNPTAYDSNNPFTTRISELTTLINNIIGGGTIANPAVGSQLYYVNLKIDNITNGTYEAPSAVTDKITEITTFLTTATTNLTAVAESISNTNAYVTYTLGDTIISSKGGLSLPRNLIASLAVGFIIGSIVAGVKGGFDEKQTLALATSHQPDKTQEPLKDNTSDTKTTK